MPWFNDIDDERPTDIEFVSEGAERFRELKRALIERFETAFKGFPDENPDRAGEILLFPIASVRVGTEAQKPEVPEREGAGWFSTDTGVLWVANRDLEWQFVETSEDDTGLKLEVTGVEGQATAPSGVSWHNFDVPEFPPSGYILVQSAIRFRLLAANAPWSAWQFSRANDVIGFQSGASLTVGGSTSRFVDQFVTIVTPPTSQDGIRYRSRLTVNNTSDAIDIEWQAVYWLFPFTRPNFFPDPQIFMGPEVESNGDD